MAARAGAATGTLCSMSSLVARAFAISLRVVMSLVLADFVAAVATSGADATAGGAASTVRGGDTTRAGLGAEEDLEPAVLRFLFSTSCCCALPDAANFSNFCNLCSFDLHQEAILSVSMQIKTQLCFAIFKKKATCPMHTDDATFSTQYAKM